MINIKYKIVLLACLATIGCATNNQNISAAHEYGRANIPLAESGNMKWSDYYLGYYEKLRLEPNKNTGNQLIIFNELIDTAKSYEAGVINKDQFDSKRRDARGKLLQLESDSQLANEESIFVQPYPPAYTPARSTTCTNSGGQIFCTTF